MKETVSTLKIPEHFIFLCCVFLCIHMCIHVNFNLRNIEGDSQALQICNHPLRKSEHQLVLEKNSQMIIIDF